MWPWRLASSRKIRVIRPLSPFITLRAKIQENSLRKKSQSKRRNQNSHKEPLKLSPFMETRVNSGVSNATCNLKLKARKRSTRRARSTKCSRLFRSDWRKLRVLITLYKRALGGMKANYTP